MKRVYLLALVMFFGLALMIFSSYRLAQAVQQQSLTGPSAKQTSGQRSILAGADVQQHVMMGYAGLALFVVGGAGGVISVFRAMSHRF